MSQRYLSLSLVFNFCASLFRIAHAEAAFQQMTDTLETLTVEQAAEMKVDPKLQECAKVCSDCQRACDLCATHCANLLADGKKEHLSCLMHCRDCATCCAACSQVCASGGPLSAVMADCCAKCCDHCAKACEAFPGDKHCKACAEECRKCEKACKAIAK